MTDTILTVRQPWATAIFRLGKDVENRTWSTGYRGRVWIHSASRPDPAAQQLPLPLSVILGHVELVDVVLEHESEWAQPGHYHWVLADPVELLVPWPAVGATGLRPFDPATIPLLLRP